MTPRPPDRPSSSADGRRSRRGGKPKPPQQREAAILALLSARTLDEAGKQCGVSERTLRRWTTSDAAFQRDLASARRTVFEQGINRIQALTGLAVDALEACIGADALPVKLQAARAALELATYHHETAVIIERLDALEGKLNTAR